MKNIIICFSIAVCTFLLVIILSVQNDFSLKRQELKQTITHTMETTLDEVMQKNNYQIKDVDDFMSMYQQYFFSNIQSDADATLKVVDIDMEKGLLVLQATYTYKQVDLKNTPKKITVQKTVLFNGKERTEL